MHGVVDRRFTRFIFVGVRLRNAQRDGSEFRSDRLSGRRPADRSVYPAGARSLRQCAPRAVAFQDAFSRSDSRNQVGCADSLS